jgi:AAA ATPase-like protein
VQAAESDRHGEPGDRIAPPLFGRERELAEVQAALADARAGHGGLVLIAGEPGIGKTRLAEAVTAGAEAANMPALWGRCWESGGAPGYWPWVQVLRGLVRDRDPAQLRAELGAGAGWVAQVLPELRDLVPGAESPGTLDSEQARFALFDAISCFLLNASRSSPLLLVIDDLHAADHASLLLLEFVARAILDAPVLLLVAYQDAAARRRPEVERVIGALGRESHPIVLRGFGEDGLARIIEHRSGRPPPPELVDALLATTDGNPFFADEVVRLLEANGQLELWVGEGLRGRFPLPDTVRETIRRRFEPLAPPGIELLGVASVIGREFRLPTLETASGVGRQELIGLLDEAVRSGLIVEVPGAIGRFRFTHGLIRETLYAGLGTAERARLHRAVGEAMESADGSDPQRLAELAHHFAEAAATGEAAKALDYATQAGHHAMRLLAYEHASEFFELAMDTTELLKPDPGRQAELVLALGHARARSGDPRARETLLQAAQAARGVDRPELLARAALAFRVFGLSPGVVDEAQIEFLEEALERLDTGDSTLRARVLARLAVALYFRPGTTERRERLVAEAIAMARRLDDPATLAYVLSNGQLATWSPATTRRSLEWAGELIRVSEEVGDAELSVAARNRQADYLLELGELSGVDIAIQTLERMAIEDRDPRARAYVSLQRSRRALLEGRFAEAERLTSEAAVLGDRLGDSIIPMLAAAQRFGLHWTEARPGELEEEVRRFADGAPGMPVWRAALATVYCELGRDAEARRELEWLAAEDFAVLPRDSALLLALALLTEVCVHLGAVEPATRMVELLMPYQDRMAISAHAIFAGPVPRCLGILATLRGEWEEASRHFAGAMAMAERTGARPTMSFLRIDEARMLTARDQPGDRARALTLLHQAREGVEELGLERIVERIDRLRGALGERQEADDAPPSPVARPAEAAGTAYLRREGDVWAFDYQQRTIRLRDSKGLRYLAELLASPGVEIHAIQLIGGDQPSGGADAAAVREAGLEVRAGGADDAGPVLDTEAKAAYQSRLEDLRDELEEAESFNDPERAARAQEEIEFLAQELAGAVGLGERDRRLGSTAERARVNATRAIRGAVKRIAEHHPDLGRELDATVRTGTFCAYEPDPRHPVAWRIEPA